MSGEQAEERTAREGRAREWYRAQLPPPPECLYCGKPMSMTPTAAGIFQYCPKGPTKGQGCTYTFTTTTNLDDGIVECLAKFAESECSRLASRVEELEERLRQYEPDPDFSQKELVKWHHTRMHEVVNRAYRVYCDTKTVFPKGLARWMGVNTEDDFSKVISEREMRKNLQEAYELVCFDLASMSPNFKDKGLDALSTTEFTECKEWIKREMLETAKLRLAKKKLLAGAHAEEKPNDV